MADKKTGGKKPGDEGAAIPGGNVEIFDDGEVITLFDDKENPVNFTQVACVDYEGEFFALLQPTDKIEGISEDEVVIFKLQEGKDNDMFVPVESEELLNKVFEQYLRAAADENSGCGCGEECDCHENGCGDDSDDDDDDDGEEECDCGHDHK